MSRFRLRTSAHVELYIGLFHSRRSEELSAQNVDEIQNTRTKKFDENDKSLQIITSPNSYLGRHPASANRNNIGAQ